LALAFSYLPVRFPRIPEKNLSIRSDACDAEALGADTSAPDPPPIQTSDHLPTHSHFLPFRQRSGQMRAIRLPLTPYASSKTI